MNAWRELAAGLGGTEAASDFLGFLALFTRMGPADRTSPDTEQVWWTAALEANLPPGALAGAGGFSTALTDDVWLPLARRSAAHTLAQTRADDIAERVAAHPRDNDALLLATDVQPAPEHPAATEQLRRALVEAGEVDLARGRRRRPADLTGPGPAGRRAATRFPVRRRARYWLGDGERSATSPRPAAPACPGTACAG